MNKHFQELAQVVGRALAKRWMQRCGGVGEGGDVRAKASSAPPPPARRPRIRYQQHK